MALIVSGFVDCTPISSCASPGRKQGNLLFPQNIGGNLEMEVGDAIVMFINIPPDLHGMLVVTIERPVNELHLFYVLIQKKLQFSFYDIYVT